MATLGPIDDAIVQKLFDESVGADRDRLAKLINFNAYGISMGQMLGDRMRVCEPPERVVRLLGDLVKHEVVVRFRYKNHVPLYFHKNNLEKEKLTRAVFQLVRR